jgi:uncharacterized protein (TIGR04562 family)
MQSFERLHPEVERERFEASFEIFANIMGLREGALSIQDEHARETIFASIKKRTEHTVNLDDDMDLVSLAQLIKIDISPLLDRFPQQDPRSMLDIASSGLVRNPDIKNFLYSIDVDLREPAECEHVVNVAIEAIEYLRDNVLVNSRRKDDDPPERMSEEIDDILGRLKIAIDQMKVLKRRLKAVDYTENEIYGHNEFTSLLDTLNLEQDIFQIFKFASKVSNPDNLQLRRQACGLLRIMEAIDYMERNPFVPLKDEAARTLHNIIRDEIEDYKEWDPQAKEQGSFRGIPLLSIQDRMKDRKRTIGKLLRSLKYGITPPFDLVGVRFETENIYDALKLLYKLFAMPGVAIFPYITVRIEDTKNLLFDEHKLRALLGDYDKSHQFFIEDMDHRELGLDLDRADIRQTEFDFEQPEATQLEDNTYSAASYRAAHVVCSINVDYNGMHSVRFPCEIQVADKESHRINEKTHPGYMERQGKSEAKRVLAGEKRDVIL